MRPAHHRRVESAYSQRTTAWPSVHSETISYSYDPAGRLIAETDFDSRTQHYAHDASGRLTTRTTPLGDTIEFTHDPLGNLTAKTAAGAVTQYSYDLAGRPTRISGPDAVLTYTYDTAGRTLSESTNGRTVSYTYDALGRRTSRTTPTGAGSAWSYDAAGNRTALTASGRTLSFTHDALGQELTRTLGPALTLTSTWDPLGRLTTHQVTGPAAQPLQHRAYTYRADGNLTAIDDALNGPRRFTLDARGRVTAVTAHNWSESYAYDAAGNQTQATWPESMPGQEATGAREYIGTRITRAGAIRYEYDAAGRTTLRQKTRLSRKPDTWCYTWDAEDRLVACVTPDGVVWRYLYDPLGRRIAKLRLAGDGEVVLERVEFAWDGTTLCEQTTHGSDSNTGLATTWDYNALEPLLQRERIYAPRAAQHEIDERFFTIVTDLVGAPTELLDEGGTIAARTRNTLWGATVWTRTATTHTPIRYPGQYFDPETQLHYNLFRHYDPATARYLTPDPLGLTPAPNPSTYVRNPHTSADPHGLTPCPLGERSNPFQNRQDAERAAYDLAGVPYGEKPVAEWTVTGNEQLKHVPGYTYSSQWQHWGHFRQFETDQGSRVIVEHTFDKAGPHFHAGKPKVDDSRSFVNFGWDNQRVFRSDGSAGYPEDMERYAKINKPGGDHHLFYRDGWGS